MEQPQLTWITNFIWGIADDALRDLYVRGKYRDVILPMTVLRRLDVVLEPTKQAVLDMKASRDQKYAVTQFLAKRIQFINEYRTRLIADVVTGKLNLREAAQHLPDEVDEPEISSAVEEMEDVEAELESE